ncbi:hypothetical protein [Polaromonas sp.]|uniref:hypothetical protein n=1 Tax=Polaromonas sp. TaxID=1869339 RepID=UPI003561638C
MSYGSSFVANIMGLTSSLLELCWLYLQLFALRSEIYLQANVDEAIGSALGLAGAYMLARRGQYAALGWIAFLGSNVALIIFAMRNGHAFLLVLQICFVVTSALGIWNYLVKPMQPAKPPGTAAATLSLNPFPKPKPIKRGPEGRDTT